MSDTSPQPDKELEIQEELLETEQAELELSVVKENLDLIVGWISHADGKATFYLTITLVLIGASLTEIPLLVTVCKKSSTCLSIILIIGHAIFYGCAFLAGYFAMHVVRPRLVPDSKKQSWYFFQSVAGFDKVEDFQEYSHAITQADRTHQLLEQTWNLSKVTHRKYKNAARADTFLRIAIVFGMVSVILTLVLEKL